MHLGGAKLAQLLGDGYDIIGFDPRGVGYTTPAVSAFLSAPESFRWSAPEPPLISSSGDVIPRTHAKADLLGILAAERSGEVARFVGTAAVARDMLQIVRAHGRDKLLYWGYSYGSVLGVTCVGTSFPCFVCRCSHDILHYFRFASMFPVSWPVLIFFSG